MSSSIKWCALLCLVLANPLAAQTSDADVGDGESFGRNVKWLGLASGFVELAADCAVPPGEPPRENCVVINPAPAVTSFEFTNLSSITLPGRSTRSLLCQWQTPVASYAWRNTTPADANARMSMRFIYRFESEVLADPTLINPLTGAPFAGAFVQSLTSINEFQTLTSGHSASRLVTFTRACIGGVVTKRYLVESLGLTSAQANEFFRKPITIRLGLAGSAQLVERAGLNASVRFLGD